MNNFVTEDTSVIKERVARGGQVLPKRQSTECVKLTLAAPGNLCGEDNVYVPPLTKTLTELRERINTAIGKVTQDMLERVWREWEYCLDICHVTRGAHIECI